jgi:hypothetical protein
MHSHCHWPIVDDRAVKLNCPGHEALVPHSKQGEMMEVQLEIVNCSLFLFQAFQVRQSAISENFRAFSLSTQDKEQDSEGLKPSLALQV